MVFINARDDPLVPDPLLEPIREFASELIIYFLSILYSQNIISINFDYNFFLDSRDKTVFVELAHGGHLGFYEGGALYPNPVTWLDRAIVAITGGLVLSHHKLNIPPTDEFSLKSKLIDEEYSDLRDFPCSKVCETKVQSM